MSIVTAQQTFALALEHHRAGRLSDAETLYRQILEAQPNHADALHFLGVIAHQTDRHDLALERIQQSLAVNPHNPAAHSNLGEVCRAMGRFDEAGRAYHQALQLQPDFPEAHNNLGLILAEQGHLEEAAAAHTRALQLRPDYADAENNLGIILLRQGRPDEAIAAYRRALQMNPDDPKANNNLGNALQERGELAAAMLFFQRALAVQPHYPEALLNTGLNYWLEARFDKAEAFYRQAIASREDFANAHLNLGMLLLLLQRHEEGWREYEWRWRAPEFTSPRCHFSAPQWDGKPIPGRTLLIHAEQGFGDTLHFARYLPLARAHSNAARVIFECPITLVPLLEQFRHQNIDLIAAGRGDDLPRFDFHLPLLSLPLALSHFEPLPAHAPYLQADDRLRVRWRERLSSTVGLRVGLAWTGNPSHFHQRRRSIAVEKLASILQIPRVHFVSLQVPIPGELPPSATPAGMSDFSAEIADFANSAALFAELDLVITVDTAAAHLAGALGRPVWTLLPFLPDWRWGLEGEQTPWYPTMRLFRQSKAGDWEEVLKRVAAALRQITMRDEAALKASTDKLRPQQ